VNSDKIEVKCSKSAIQAVEFEFCLQESGFTVVERYQSESAVMAFSRILWVALGKEEADSNMQGVDQ
jgi:hypothetical protein